MKLCKCVSNCIYLGLQCDEKLIDLNLVTLYDIIDADNSIIFFRRLIVFVNPKPFITFVGFTRMWNKYYIFIKPERDNESNEKSMQENTFVPLTT